MLKYILQYKSANLPVEDSKATVTIAAMLLGTINKLFD